MNKTTTSNRGIALSLLMLLAISAAVAALPTVSASNPPLTIPTWTYVAVSNNPIGLNQPQTIIFWTNCYPPTAVGASGDRWTFNVEVSKPDGTKDMLGPFISDPVGNAYCFYTPKAIGTYSVVATFAGKKIDGSPNGYAPGYGPMSFGYSSINDTYLASTSDAEKFVCQQEAIEPWQEPPLPNGYWTTPVNCMNRGWAPLVANWLGASAAQTNGPTASFGWGQAPESAHIVWTTPLWSGGIMDARYGAMNYETIHYEGLSFNPIILDGRIFYNVQSLPREGWYCKNLYTGETEYFQNTTGPVSGVGGGFYLSGQIAEGQLSFGQVLDYQSPNQMGGFPYLWSTPVSNMFGGATSQTDWRMYDAYTGNYICSIANATSPLIVNGQPVMTFGMFGPTPVMVGATGTQVWGKDGSVCYYNIVNAGTAFAPQYRLQVWNTSQVILAKANADAAAAANNAYWMWRPILNYTFDGSKGFSLDVNIPNVSGAGSILTIRDGKYVIGGTGGKNNGTFIQKGQIWALNLDPAKGAIGSLLWNTTFTPPQTVVPDVVAGGLFGGGLLTLAGGGFFGGASGVSPEDDVFLFQEAMTRRWWGYSLSTGQQLWGPSEPENPWNFYGMSFNIYNGLLLSAGGGMSGSELIAYNMKTGQVVWRYTPAQEGFESPYGLYPITISLVADGKIYLFSREHHQIGYIWRGGYIRCINATDGKEIWKMDSWGSGVALSNGYLVGWNGYDNQIYCYGKGPSATTVTLRNDVVTKGSDVFITGSVSDQSAGAKTRATNFGYTDGVPAMSDADQRAWMGYIYMQQAFPANAKGVKVHLTAIDPNNNFQDIGTATTDIGGTFGIAWTPPVEGTYKVTASFDGSKSYGNSYATTQFEVVAPSAQPAVQPTPAEVSPTPPPVQPTQPPVQTASPSPTEAVTPPAAAEPTMTYIAIGAAIIIIIAAVAALVLRKRK
jgi:hypothetical protein